KAAVIWKNRRPSGVPVSILRVSTLSTCFFCSRSWAVSMICLRDRANRESRQTTRVSPGRMYSTRLGVPGGHDARQTPSRHRAVRTLLVSGRRSVAGGSGRELRLSRSQRACPFLKPSRGIISERWFPDTVGEHFFLGFPLTAWLMPCRSEFHRFRNIQ